MPPTPSYHTTPPSPDRPTPRSASSPNYICKHWLNNEHGALNSSVVPPHSRDYSIWILLHGVNLQLPACFSGCTQGSTDQWTPTCPQHHQYSENRTQLHSGCRCIFTTARVLIMESNTCNSGQTLTGRLFPSPPPELCQEDICAPPGDANNHTFPRCSPQTLFI